MDYIDHVDIVRHANFAAFQGVRPAGRLVLLSTKASVGLYDFAFEPGDTLLFGMESAGVPDDVSAACDAAIKIPTRPQVRSFNLATSAAIALGEALRQTQGLPA
jgi:tRNA (cytidine/uridine-2'-O-)-methyltransferase